MTNDTEQLPIVKQQTKRRIEYMHYMENKAGETTSMTEVGTVFVPVTDQDRALAFYVEKPGFKQLGDWPYGDGARWVEVAPPGSTNKIALVPQSEGKAAPTDWTLCAFGTTNIEADHTLLRAREVAVDPEIAQQGKARTGLISTECTIPNPAPAQLCFRDMDGNRFLLVQV